MIAIDSKIFICDFLKKKSDSITLNTLILNILAQNSTILKKNYTVNEKKNYLQFEKLLVYNSKRE